MAYERMDTPFAYFRIVADDLPLEAITAAMGTTPTWSWRKGDASRYNRSRPNAGWCLQPAPPGDDALFAHVEAVVALLRERAAIVRALSDAYGADIVCVGEYDQTTSPGLYLARGTIADMAAMGVGLDADLYFAADSD